MTTILMSVDPSTVLVQLVLLALVATASVVVTRALLQRQSATPGVEELLRPIDDALRQLQGWQLQADEAERRRIADHAELRAVAEFMGQSTRDLRQETAQLVTALRAPQVRGRWGETQLRRVVELAGLVDHCDFDEQVTFQHDGATVRPDLVVHLAGGRHVVVDAKVSFAAVLDALAATDPDVVAERMQAHARHVRSHIDDLASKQYWVAVDDSPDFVVMFIPAEQFLTAALEADPSLLEYAFERNVVIATPTTLIALLRTVAWGWRHEALDRNAYAIHAVGKELYGRLTAFAGHLNKMGSALQSAVTAYNQSIGSWESRVLVSARRLDDLDIGDGQLPDTTVVELGVRAMRDTTSSRVG